MNNNECFQFSIPAQNIEARFYNKKGIVYVEGPDDIIFWSQYFDASMFVIRQKDGCNNLKDYENDIIHHGLKCIVAKDSDYSVFHSSDNNHPLIVCTLSHSIECVMYCPNNINAYLQRLARTLDDYTNQIESLYDSFCEECTELIVYDIANSVFGVGCSVCGDSCLPFMNSNKSVKVSSEKIKDFIKKIQPNFTSLQISEASKYLSEDKRHKRQIFKGHFQTNFVINLLKYLTSKITGCNAPSVSKDALYAQLVKCDPGCPLSNCEEKTVIMKQVNRAITVLCH